MVGYTGQVSLGHAGLFGIGSYATGVLVFKLGLPFWLAMPASIVGAAVFGAILALPALRVTGPYLAMVTLAFGTIVQILINEMSFLTEGPMGIKIHKPSMFGHKLSEVEYYYMVAALMVISLIVVHRILKSNLGRAFEALRDSPIASDCMGVSVYRYKVYAFVISAGFAGLAGSLYAYSEEYISPNTYNFELTILVPAGRDHGRAQDAFRFPDRRADRRDAAQPAVGHRTVPQDCGGRRRAGRDRFRLHAGEKTQHACAA